MTDGTDVVAVRSRIGPSGGAALVVFATVLAVALIGPAAANAPILSCATGDAGVHYTAPSNLTVADASDATVDGPFAGNESVAVGNVTVSADGTAFARVETATGATCLSEVDATNATVIVDTDAATVAVDGSVAALAFDDPAADDVAFAYRAGDGSTLTLADAGHPSGTTLRVLDAETDRELDVATVASDGSLSLPLPASEAGTRVRLTTPADESTTPGPTPADASPTPTGTADAGTDSATGEGSGVLWPLLVAITLLAAIGAVAVYLRRE